LETLYLFKFDPSATVPLADSIQEFAYYYGFGLWIAGRTSDVNTTNLTWAFILGAWIGCEYCNFVCHRTLAGLKRRKDGKKTRPEGNVLFSRSSCPHYFFEISSWFLFNFLTGFTLPGCLFMSVGAIIMTCWAVKRHEGYGDDEEGKQTPLFPFVDLRPPRILVDALAKA